MKKDTKPAPSEHKLTEKALLDLKLIERAKKEADGSGYTAIMNKYRESVYYVILRIVNNKSDAEDLTQEAFTKAFKNIESYQPTFAFSTWLFKIASNCSIDFLRKRRFEYESLEMTSGEDDTLNPVLHEVNATVDQGDSIDEVLVKRQERANLLARLDKLSPKYSELIRLRFFEELTYEEIAEQLDLPMGTVKARLHRSKDLLLKVIGERENIER